MTSQNFKMRINISTDMPNKTVKKTMIFLIVWMFLLMLPKYDSIM